MATLDQISALTDIGKLFYLKKLNDENSKLADGKSASYATLIGIKRLITGLTFQIQAAVNDDRTTDLFKCLMKNIAGFTGTYTPDADVVLPGRTVILNYGHLPPATTIGYGDMTEAGTRYDNPLWAGFDPIMILDTAEWLIKGVDYTLLPSGGFILSPAGSPGQIYAGQNIWVVNFKSTTVGGEAPDNDGFPYTFPFILS